MVAYFCVDWYIFRPRLLPEGRSLEICGAFLLPTNCWRTAFCLVGPTSGNLQNIFCSASSVSNLCISLQSRSVQSVLAFLQLCASQDILFRLIGNQLTFPSCFSICKIKKNWFQVVGLPASALLSRYIFRPTFPPPPFFLAIERNTQLFKKNRPYYILHPTQSKYLFQLLTKLSSFWF